MAKNTKIRVAIFGAAGALGKRVLPLLKSKDCESTCLVRGSADRLSETVVMMPILIESHVTLI